MSSAIEITGLRHAHAVSGAPSLRIPRFSLGAGEHLAIRGESGCGKTTLLHLIAGILRPEAGEIRVGGESMTALGESARDRLRARRIGLVFQAFNLLPGFSVEENLRLAQDFAGARDLARIRILLERLGLAPLARRSPERLSTGQRQRVALARALVNRPDVVLADEPTASLDDLHASRATGLLRELCVENGSALLLVTHDARALRECPRVADFAALTES